MAGLDLALVAEDLQHFVQVGENVIYLTRDIRVITFGYLVNFRCHARHNNRQFR